MGSLKVIMMRFLCLFDKPKKKFVLTNRYIIRDGVKLYRIKCTKSFGPVKEGEYGGYVEGEYNLSQRGFAWVYGDACVFGNAKLLGNAKVCDSACVYGSAIVCDNAKVFGDACVSDNAIIGDCAKVYGNAGVYGNAKVYGSAWVSGNAKVYGSACVFDGACVFDDACVSGNAKVYGSACVYDKAKVYGNAKVCGYKWLSGYDSISGDESLDNITKNHDYNCLVTGNKNINECPIKDKIEIMCDRFCRVELEVLRRKRQEEIKETKRIFQGISDIIKKGFGLDEKR